MAKRGDESTGTAAGGERGLGGLLARLQARPVLLWVVALGLTLVAFYAMNHLVMAGQGLPLNLDLTPAQ